MKLTNNGGGVNAKILYLEGLRGLSMIIIILNHFAAAFYPTIIFGGKASPHIPLELIIYRTPLNIFFSGIFALSIFYLLSGYLLSYKYFRFHKEELLISSIVYRYLRLAIPTLVSILIAYTLLKFHLFYNISVSSITGSTMWFANFWNFDANIYKAVVEGIFMISVIIGNQTYNPVLWMMAYELAGSILVFFALEIFKHTKIRYPIYFFLLLITFAWKGYLMGFIFGMLICNLEYRSNLNVLIHEKKNLGFVFLILAITLGSFPIASTKNTLYDFIKIPMLGESKSIILYQTMAACFLFLAIKNLKILRSLLEFSVLRFLGRISFSVFFLHLIIVGSFSSYLFKIFINYFSYNVSVLITFLTSIPVILVAAFFFNKHVILYSLKIANTAKGLINKRIKI